jgi:hypothetical protein
MTFAGAELVSGEPAWSTIVPITKRTTYKTPPRTVQRATLRGRAIGTAASMEPPSEREYRCPTVGPSVLSP